ncbi:MAG: hypothetical protein QXQ29_03940 [Candidatus Bathyarchaeia archaeon]
MKVRVDEKSIIIEPLEPIADRYFGAFKITRRPEELDEFTVEAIGVWWIRKAT